MIDTMEPTPTAAATMVATGQQMIADLQGKQAELDRHIADAQNELAAIADSRDYRTQGLSTARSTFEQAEFSESQARGYAQLAQTAPGSLMQTDSVKKLSEAKKSLRTAKKELERLQSEAVQGEASAVTREQELGKHISLLQSERETRQSEIDAIERGLSQAHLELGQERYTAIMEGYQVRQARVEELRTQLAEAEVELLDLHEAALTELAGWDDLRREILRLRPVEDATTRMLESTISHLEALACHYNDARTDIPLSWGIRQELIIPEGHLGYPGQLQERAQRLRRVLTEHRDYIVNNS